METEHNEYIRAQEALPYLERAAMLCKHYDGDGCRIVTATQATEQAQKEYCEYDGAELDEAMECPECLQLIIEHAAFRTGKTQNPTATITLIRRAKGFENFGVQ